MIEATIDTAAIGCTKDYTTTVKFIATAIAEFSRFIDDLVKGGNI